MALRNESLNLGRRDWGTPSASNSFQGVSQATHRFLLLLRECDLRQGWRAYGNNECAQWLDWRCGISRTTAQEKVRVAWALWMRAKVDKAFEQRVLDAHRVRHGSDGGETSPENTILLCDRHHRLVHEGGFGVARDRDYRYYFTRPDGRPVAGIPSAPESEVREFPAPSRVVSPSAEGGNSHPRFAAVT